MIIWWSKHVGVIFNVLVCDIWINVLLRTSALVGLLYIVNWNARWNSEIRKHVLYKYAHILFCINMPIYCFLLENVLLLLYRMWLQYCRWRRQMCEELQHMEMLSGIFNEDNDGKLHIAFTNKISEWCAFWHLSTETRSKHLTNIMCSSLCIYKFIHYLVQINIKATASVRVSCIYLTQSNIQYPIMSYLNILGVH
jgi:hypothetical protein